MLAWLSFGTYHQHQFFSKLCFVWKHYLDAKCIFFVQASYWYHTEVKWFLAVFECVNFVSSKDYHTAIYIYFQQFNLPSFFPIQPRIVPSSIIKIIFPVDLTLSLDYLRCLKVVKWIWMMLPYTWWLSLPKWWFPPEAAKFWPSVVNFWYLTNSAYYKTTI